MLNKDEIKLIKLIKIAPIFIIIAVCSVITILLSIEKNISLNNDFRNLEKDYLEKNKETIKNQVENVYNYIVHKKLNSENELKEDIKNQIDKAFDIVNYIYEKYKDKESKEEIISRIKDSLKAVRFNNNRGYYYIYTIEGTNVLHPINPEFENKFMLNHKDNLGNFVIRDIFKDLENKKEAYTTLYWAKPEDLKNQYKKITYNKIFEPYNLVIGTGEYLNDFEEITKEKILSYISSIRYDKNDYVFVVDKEGVYLSHFEKSYVGLNRIELKDPNGFMITKEIINTAKDGNSGYLQYVGTIKPQTKLPSKKITYVRGFEDWNWAIASGFYTDELEKQILEKQDEVKEKYTKNLIGLLLISLFITAIFSFISFYISKKLERRFYKYKRQVYEHMKKNREKDTMIAQQTKMAAMGEMIENIAHQWRQPLSTISTISSGIKLQYEYSEVQKEEAIKSMDTILTTTQYLSQTIDDFRDYFNSKKEANYFSLKDILGKVCALIEPQLYSKNIQIIKDIDELTIFGLENEFLQVIINILNNSKDEFERKEFENKFIFINTEVTEDKIIIKIKDSAGGIDENIINNIFESYFTTKQETKGTGIGLYMSKEIIEKHMKGTLSVSNEEYIYLQKNYKGATFLITLPFLKKAEDIN
jgi:signal transduction histidine kinase